MMASCLCWLNPPCRFAPLAGPRLAIQNFVGRGESLPAQTARVLPGAQDQAPADFPPNALDPPVAQPLVRLAQRVDGRDA